MKAPTTYDERQLAEIIAYCVGFSLLVSTIIFLIGYIIVIYLKSDISFKALFFNPLFWITFAANANLGAMIGRKMVQRKSYIDNLKMAIKLTFIILINHLTLSYHHHLVNENQTELLGIIK